MATESEKLPTFKDILINGGWHYTCPHCEKICVLKYSKTKKCSHCNVLFKSPILVGSSNHFAQRWDNYIEPVQDYYSNIDEFIECFTNEGVYIAKVRNKRFRDVFKRTGNEFVDRVIKRYKTSIGQYFIYRDDFKDIGTCYGFNEDYIIDNAPKREFVYRENKTPNNYKTMVNALHESYTQHGSLFFINMSNMNEDQYRRLLEGRRIGWDRKKAEDYKENSHVKYNDFKEIIEDAISKPHRAYPKGVIRSIIF